MFFLIHSTDNFESVKSVRMIEIYCNREKGEYPDKEEAAVEIENGIRVIAKASYHEKLRQTHRAGFLEDCRNFFKEKRCRLFKKGDLELAVQLYAYSLKGLPRGERQRRGEIVRKTLDQYCLSTAFKKELQDYYKCWSFLIPTCYLSLSIRLMISKLIFFTVEKIISDKTKLPHFEDQYQKTIEAAALSEVQERFGKLADAKYDLVKGDLSRAAVYLLKWSAAEEPAALLNAVKQYESKSVTNKLDKLVRINEFLVEKVKKTERFLIYSLFRVANRTFHHLLVQPKAQWDKYWTIGENLIVAEERTALEPALETTLRYLRMGVFSGPLIDQTCSMITGLVHSAASSNKLIEEKAQEIVKARALQSDIPWKDLWDAFQKNTGISDADGYVLREAIEAQTENAIREQQQKMDADKAAAELIAQEQPTKRRRNKRGGQRRQTGNRQIQVSQKKPAQQEVVEKAEKKPVKDDQKTSELLRLGLEQGIAFRIQEVKEIKRRLKIASENLASDGSADIRQFKNCLDSLTGDLDRLEKHSVVSTDGDQVSKLMGYVCQVDDHLLEGRKLLRDLARLSSNREKFDTELKSLIKSETLRAGRTDGGRISDHNIDFEFIEAWYHGLKLDLRKKEVVISGATRKLAPNEALVLYVTLSSRTQDVKYCISIGLWEMRTVSDPAPNKHDRNQFLGSLNLDQKIDPDLWKYTGKRMAVLHIVSPEVLRKGTQS